MKKKSSRKLKKAAKHGPSWALALVAILAPVLTAGALPLFAADTPQTLFDFSIFDGQEFLRSRRERHSAADVVPPVIDEGTTSSATTVNPCDPVPLAIPASEPVAIPELTVDDLSLSEREALRGQLRSRACPQKADPAYLALCRRLVREMPEAETRTGTSNPHQ